MNPTELLPCPFCNGAPVIKQRDYEYRVECENRHTTCPVNMRTHYHVETDDAWRDWNTRTPAEPATPSAREAEGIAIHGLKEAIYGDFDDASDLKSELVAIARELFYKGHTTLVTRIEECAKQVDVVAHAHTAAEAVEDERQRLARLVEEFKALASKPAESGTEQFGKQVAYSHVYFELSKLLTGDVGEKG